MKIHKEDSKQLVRLLWSLSGKSRQGFAAAVGIDPSTLWRYEKGKIVPDRTLLRQMAAVSSISIGVVDLWLLPALTTARLTRAASLGQESEPPGADGDCQERAGTEAGTIEELPPALDTAELGRAVSEVCRMDLSALLARLDAPAKTGANQGKWSAWNGEELAETCAGLETCTLEELRVLAEACPEFQSPAVVAWLCERSVEAASASGGEAVELVNLALRVLELLPIEDALLLQMRGECLVFRANALRVANSLKEAAATFAEAERLTQSGAAEDTSLRPRWRLLDLEASLRRDQRDFERALSLLAAAFEDAPPAAKARILGTKAGVHEHAGQHESAVQALREAAPYLERYPEPRLLFGCAFNLAHNLCCLNHAAEAEALLPEIRERAAARKLDCVRVTWLEGKVAAGLGREAEARAAFQQVQREFCQLKMPCDGALVSLDLAVLHLQHGRAAEVRALAEEMIWIFESQDIHREALAALDLFCQAARQEAATAELARRVAGYLQTSRHDPERRFDP